MKVAPPTPTLASEPKLPLIAVIGQPNVGKSTVFNRLTGLRQRVGNYPGVTVERKVGRLLLANQMAEIVDLPGTYSLNALSPDELITLSALTGEAGIERRPDVVLCVVEASRIERSLIPAFQVAPLGVPVVIAVNFLDEARKNGVQLDLEELGRRLRVPVVGTVARSGEGIEKLKEALAHALTSEVTLPEPDWPPAVRSAIERLQPYATNSSGQPCRFLAQRLLFDSNNRAAEFISIEPAHRPAVLESARNLLLQDGYHPTTAEPVLLFAHIKQLLDGVVKRSHQTTQQRHSGADAWLLHPLLGLVIFVLVMFGVFQAVYSWAAPLIEGIEHLTSFSGEKIEAWLEPFPMLKSLAVDGLIAGLGSIAVFLPQILILTALISLLEDSGYLSRAAFLIDRIFGWCGLNGKSFVPLMSSFACAIPGILSARTIEESRTRLATIFIAPLMSCSARLPVYVVMIGAVIEPIYGPHVAGMVLFAMHMLGPIVAFPLIWIVNKYILRSKPPPFLLELPPFRLPSLTDVLYRLWQRTSRFLTDAGTIIFCITIIIWALLYFPRDVRLEQEEKQRFLEETISQGLNPAEVEAAIASGEGELAEALDKRIAAVHIENSLLGRAGRFLQPLFHPAGFDWRITVAVLASFPAREVVISTLGVIYQLGGDADEESSDLRTQIRQARWTSGPQFGQPVFTVPTAVSVMVFFALCMQCGATLAIIKAESGWRWAVAAFFVMTTLAWIGAVLSFQGLSLLFPTPKGVSS